MDMYISYGLICGGYMCMVGLPTRARKVVVRPVRARKDKVDLVGDALRNSFPVIRGFDD